MNTSHFYRRYDADGRCKVICMHCFQTLGRAWDRTSVEAMESAHICEFQRQETPTDAARRLVRQVASATPLVQHLLRVPAGLLALLVVLVAYALPTALELAARHELNPWLAVIVPGNVIGCALLAGLLRRPRTAAVLYMVLTMMEGLSYASGAARGRELLWFADLVPMLVVLILLLRTKQGGRALAVS